MNLYYKESIIFLLIYIIDSLSSQHDQMYKELKNSFKKIMSQEDSIRAKYKNR